MMAKNALKCEKVARLCQNMQDKWQKLHRELQKMQKWTIAP